MTVSHVLMTVCHALVTVRTYEIYVWHIHTGTPIICHCLVIQRSKIAPCRRQLVDSRVTTTAQDVLLYIPNLIGYARVLSELSSFVLIMSIPVCGSWPLCYLSAFVGDLFDGMAARAS